MKITRMRFREGGCLWDTGRGDRFLQVLMESRRPLDSVDICMIA